MLKFKCGCMYENAKDKTLTMHVNCKSNTCVIEDNEDMFIGVFKSNKSISWQNEKLEQIKVDAETGVRILND